MCCTFLTFSWERAERVRASRQKEVKPNSLLLCKILANSDNLCPIDFSSINLGGYGTQDSPHRCFLQATVTGGSKKQFGSSCTLEMPRPSEFMKVECKFQIAWIRWVVLISCVWIYWLSFYISMICSLSKGFILRRILNIAGNQEFGQKPCYGEGPKVNCTWTRLRMLVTILQKR